MICCIIIIILCGSVTSTIGSTMVIKVTPNRRPEPSLMRWCPSSIAADPKILLACFNTISWHARGGPVPHFTGFKKDPMNFHRRSRCDAFGASITTRSAHLLGVIAFSGTRGKVTTAGPLPPISVLPRCRRRTTSRFVVRFQVLCSMNARRSSAGSVNVFSVSRFSVSKISRPRKENVTHRRRANRWIRSL